MNRHEILSILEKELLALLPILKGYITQNDEDLLKEFITHCECGLAYEEIVATINFQKIPISLEIYEKIIKIGKIMNFDEQNWVKLKYLIKDS